jgi:hypothetical protein
MHCCVNTPRSERKPPVPGEFSETHEVCFSRRDWANAKALCALLGALLSLSVQLLSYLQVPPPPTQRKPRTQAILIRARQQLQSCLGVHSTALLSPSACSI